MTQEEGHVARAAFLKKVNFLTMEDYRKHMSETGGWGCEAYQAWVKTGRVPIVDEDGRITNFQYGVEY